MTITVASRKAKGRNLQKWVRNIILTLFPKFTIDDCHSRAMGSQGEDIMLSSTARKILPIQIECKAMAKSAIYKDYYQAMTHGPWEPVLIIKANKQRPLAIVDAKYFLAMWKIMHQLNTKDSG